MNQSPPNDEILDLESSTLIEAADRTLCPGKSESPVDELNVRLDEPHGSRRCPSKSREIFANQFPAE